LSSRRGARSFAAARKRRKKLTHNQCNMNLKEEERGRREMISAGMNTTN